MLHLMTNCSNLTLVEIKILKKMQVHLYDEVFNLKLWSIKIEKIRIVHHLDIKQQWI